MRALTIDHNRLALNRDYPEPGATAGESLVRVRMAGICGTDLELARGYMNHRGVPGHEFVGEVIQSADPTLTGKRVVGEINASCGKCAACVSGLGRHCPNRTVLGILGRDGAFAEYLRLPDANLLPVPDPIDDDVAVFAEPVAAAYEIFEQASIPRNHNVLILGDGRLGALVALAFRAEGYAVMTGGHHREKGAQLEAVGLRYAEERELKRTFDVVVDCTGSAGGFRRAVELVRPRGTLILKSTVAGAIELNLAPLVVNEISVIGSRCGRFGPALAALATRKIDPRLLISAIYSLDDGVAAFKAAATPGNFKVLLKVS